jgi:hypothetical protein
MRVEEMREREDYEKIFAATLAKAFDSASVQNFTVRLTSKAGEQAWSLQPLLNAYYVADVRRDVRRYLRDSFRYTLIKQRLVPQFVVGSMLTTAAGLRRFGRPGFGIRPAIPGAQSKLIVPGNQRVRLFDFSTGLVRAFLKSGFDDRTMKTELKVRGPGKAGPFPNVTRHADDASWFEEGILDGYALARCPPWLRRTELEREAFRLLAAWSSREASSRASGELADALAQRLSHQANAIEERFHLGVRPLLLAQSRRLVAVAGTVGTVLIGPSHGDFQAGNVIVARDGKSVLLTDWEHSATRFALYDRIVYGLGTRGRPGMAERMVAFAAGRKTGFPLEDLPRSPAWRRGALALFLLEDLLWFLDESTAGPYRTLPRGLRSYMAELARLGPNLERLFGER